MTNNQDEDDLLSDTKDIVKKIDDLPLHSKNKVLIYQCYVLSKLSLNLTIVDIGITCVKESLDSIANQYVRIWPEIPIAGTLDIMQLSKRKFGICYVMVSARFTQCQTAIRNNLRKFSNRDVVRICHDTNCDTNLQPLGLHSSKNQTLSHVVARCETSLREKCYNYRHYSILLNLVKILEPIKSIDINALL